MQDKYVGDIGDYVKLGLLRALMEDRKYKLGVAWYRVPDEKDKKDGSKIEYLDRSDLYAELDRELFDHLYRLRKVSDEPRTIESLQTVLPGAVSFSESMIAADWHENRRESRKKWFARALEHLSGCDIVFADPDNGIVDDEDKRKGRKDFCKRIPLQEVRDLVRGRCGIIYHHNARPKGGHDWEVDRWLDLLGMPAIAVRAKAWSPRTFFVINPDSDIKQRVRAFCEKWKDIRVQLHEPRGFEVLRGYRKKTANRRILDLFGSDRERAGKFSVRALDMLFDYSKTNIDSPARERLLALAETAGLMKKREAMFAGERINETEDRAVLHFALRNPEGAAFVDGMDVMPAVRETLERMETFAEGLRSSEIRAPGGGVFSDVVNIGIGGSDLGPAMAVQALAPYADGPRCHFVSNVDGAHVADALKSLDPETTLAIVASKTFATVETMANAATIRRWIAAKVGEDVAGGHFAGVTAAADRAAEFGIDPSRIFGFEDWAGGRYSLWGPVGLPLMIAIGPPRFREFLSGGAAMDAHFREAEGADNMPLMLALTGLWHNQVCGQATRAVLPYDQRLARLPAYLQQLEMESNGKRVAMDGSDLIENSCPVILGEPGTNGQHAFFQMLHQGTRIVPCEFMVAAEGHEEKLANHHRLLVANCLAQSEALMRGRSEDEAKAMLAGRYEGEELERQARHRTFPGDRPSTTLIYPKLTPKVLGQIVALYEHRTFVEGTILGINSFDQWGVELGKELAGTLERALAGDGCLDGRDESTRQLAEFAMEAGGSEETGADRLPRS